MKKIKQTEDYFINDIDEIDPFAELFITKLVGPSCIAFSGEMGTGKTTIITALLKKLGVENTQGSPTYSIIQSYLLTKKENCYHLDAYRIENETEAFQIGLEELFEENAYFFVEWPEKIVNFLPINTIWVYIREVEQNKRLITF
jgi:tRNA threonylcarbamoyladenosine biosynthesis protein TsaE